MTHFVQLQSEATARGRPRSRHVMLGSHCQAIDKKKTSDRHLSTETRVGKLFARYNCWLKHGKSHA